MYNDLPLCQSSVRYFGEILSQTYSWSVSSSAHIISFSKKKILSAMQISEIIFDGNVMSARLLITRLQTLYLPNCGKNRELTCESNGR